MDLISKSLQYIGENYEKASVIQIGAMDGISFDNTRHFLNSYKWDAILVEPIPVLFEELKNNFKDRTNYIFEQSAIADHDGEVEMLTIPPDVILKEELHIGYKGMSGIVPLKNGFGSNYQRDIDTKEKHGVYLKVPSLTFQSLLNKHNVTEFDILICDAEGYDWNIFKQLDLTKYRPKFIRLEYINLTEEEQSLLQKKLLDNNYVIEIGNDIDAVAKEIWDNIESSPEEIKLTDLSEIKNQIKTLSSEDREKLLNYLNNPNLEINNTELTVVTGLWNIGRPGRDFSHYIEHFKRFLDIPVNMFIYIPKEYEYLVWEKRSKENTYVKLYELDDIKNIYKPFWERTQNIRTNPEWYNQTGEGGWLTQSPQASLEWYNPIVQSKMFMLSDASIWDPFSSEYFIWLDAGISNTVYEKFFTDNRALDKINPFLDTFLFLSYPYETNDEIHGFNKKEIDRISQADVKYVCRGGLFGGRKEVIREANADYYNLLDSTLNRGVMGTEESIFSIMAHLNPALYRRYELDGNGLIVKFIQNLLDDKAELVPIKENKLRLKAYNPSLKNVKTSLYMLTFNFPQQIEHTLETWKNNSPDWLEKPRKILIDNSTDEQARIGNAEVAAKYGFEHIIMNENKGINGGRQFAAEHFQESDSDFYFFFEDDMGFYPSTEQGFCRNGFRKYIPNLYDKVHKIMIKEKFDFLKLSFTEVYMDNYIQVSWYNVPQSVRSEQWPDYDRLPISGLDPNAPRTNFKNIDVFEELSYASGDIYYANWPMIVGKEGNQKMFLDTTWAHPFEQTWMSYMYQETIKGNLNPSVLLASPVWHNRIIYYQPEERREN